MEMDNQLRLNACGGGGGHVFWGKSQKYNQGYNAIMLLRVAFLWSALSSPVSRLEPDIRNFISSEIPDT